MKRRMRIGIAPAALALFALSAFVIVSCSKKPTSVDPGFTTPEGISTDDSRLVVWPDLPTRTREFKDNSPLGPDPNDEFIAEHEYQRHSPGTLNGMLFDGTNANAFQMFRREPNGGLLQLFDYTLPPERRWLDGHWEVYEFSDATPPTDVTPSYVGRGLLAGSATDNSPVTNVATYQNPSVPNLPLIFPSDTTVTWNPVPGAKFYIGHIYQYREAGTLDRLLSAAPAPIYVGKSRDYFLGFADAPTILGNNQPFQGLVLSRRIMTPGQYYARVTAIDGQGQLLAYSYGDSETVTRTGTYERFLIGGAVLPRPPMFGVPSARAALPPPGPAAATRRRP